MPTSARDVMAAQFAAREATVLAEFGAENLEALNEVYQAFAANVDVDALLGWKLGQGMDALLLPLFRAALVAITKDLRLGELAPESEPPRTEWANRLELPDGHSELHEAGPVREGGGERMARQRMQYAWYTALLKRTVTYGPWVEVPVEEAGDA